MNRQVTALKAKPKPTRAEQRVRLAHTAARTLSRVDARLKALIRKIGPHRPILSSDPFATLFCSIVQQQISMAAAAAVQRKLRAMCPRGRFTPAAVLALSDDELRAGGLSRQKVKYVRDLAEHFDDGRIKSHSLRRMDDDAVIASVTQVKGIGRWTAEMLLMFCLERPDVWPIDDLGLQKAVRNHIGADGLPDKHTMQAAGEPFRPWRSYASWYLWRSLEGPFMPGIEL